jgi:uncharacterized protein DUF6463
MRGREEGALLRALAIAHALVGLAFYRRELTALYRDGLIGGVPNRGDKATAFWFLLPSPLVWVIGRLVSDAGAAGDDDALRRAHGVSLISATVAILCMPVSGFWAWLAISVRGLKRARRR